MNIIKKLLVVSGGALLLASAASATEVYNKEGTTLTVGGYASGSISSDSGGNTHGTAWKGVEARDETSRINIGGTHKLNNTTELFGLVEYGFNMMADQEEKAFGNRLNYFGIKNDSFGSLLFGKNWSTYYSVAGWTDVFAIKGGEALGVYDDGDNGGFSGLGRANGILQYSNKIAGLDIGLQVQGMDTPSDELANGVSGPTGGILGHNNGPVDSQVAGLKRDYSGSIALAYNFTKEFKVGVTGHHSEMSNATDTSTPVTGDEYDKNAYAFGLQYDSNVMTIAFEVGSVTNIYDKDTTSLGSEGFIAYKYDSMKSYIYVGYNYQTTDGGDSSSTGTGKTTEHKYAVIGAEHFLTKQFSVFTEFKYDMRSDTEKEESRAGVYGLGNNFGVGATYNF